MTAVEIRAINPDNDVEVNQVVELYEKVYGKCFPLESVYSSLFWKTHIGTRFLSLVAIKDGQLLAHLAVSQDQDNPRHVQIVFPIIDPDYADQSEKILRKTGALITKLAKRQQWSMIYNIMSGAENELAFSPHSFFAMSEVSIYPGYFPRCAHDITEAKHDTEAARSLVVSQKIFSKTGKDKRPIQLYIPSKHREVCEYLLDPLGLNREIVTGQTLKEVKPSHNLDTTSSKPFDTNLFSKVGVEQTFIKPSLFLLEPEANKHQILSASHRENYVFVDCRDMACPDVCTLLEKSGFKFTGLLPVIKNSDYMVFWKGDNTSLESSRFEGARAQVLAQYAKKPEFKLALATSLSGEEASQLKRAAS